MGVDTRSMHGALCLVMHCTAIRTSIACIARAKCSATNAMHTVCAACGAPEKRPSVTSATSLPRPQPMSAPPGISISGIPGHISGISRAYLGHISGIPGHISGIPAAHIWLQPRHVWLQPAADTVAACDRYGCSLPHMVAVQGAYGDGWGAWYMVPRGPAMPGPPLGPSYRTTSTSPFRTRPATMASYAACSSSKQRAGPRW